MVLLVKYLVNSLIQDVVVKTGLCKGVDKTVADFPSLSSILSHISDGIFWISLFSCCGDPAGLVEWSEGAAGSNGLEKYAAVNPKSVWISLKDNSHKKKSSEVWI